MPDRSRAPCLAWRWTTLALGATLLCATRAPFAAPTEPQLAHQMFQYVITKFGKPCKSVAKAQPIGRGSNGDALVAVACSNGQRHVVRIHKDNSIAYMTTCEDFKEQTQIECFAGRGKEEPSSGEGAEKSP